MTGPEKEPFSEILEKVSFLTPIDFTRADPEGLTEIVRRLVYAARYFNAVAITDFGGRTGGEREPGLVEHVVGAAFQVFGEEDPHPHPFQKAALLIRGITQGHPFFDGNKRTGFLITMYYLKQVGYPPPPYFPEDELVDFSLRLSAGRIRDLESIAEKIAHFWRYPPTSS